MTGANGLQFDVAQTRPQVEAAITATIPAGQSFPPVGAHILLDKTAGGQVRLYTRTIIAVED